MDQTKKNIYQKLADARVEFLNAKLKKSGKNQFANYEYFELDDILPTITQLEQKYGMLSTISFDSEFATLKVVNCDNPEESVRFTCEVKKCEIQKATEIMQYGGTITYTRRYLYLTCWNVCECDMQEAYQKVAPIEKKEEPKEVAVNQPKANYPKTPEEVDIEYALNYTTKKGVRFEDAEDSQLQWTLENATSPILKRCAELVLEYRKQELEEMAEISDELTPTDEEVPF